MPIKASAEHSDRHRNVRFLDQFADKYGYDYSEELQREGPSDSSDITGVVPADPTEGMNLKIACWERYKDLRKSTRRSE